MKKLSYRDWCEANLEDILIELAESGADRELCFDLEIELEDRYSVYYENS